MTRIRYTDSISCILDAAVVLAALCAAVPAACVGL